MKHIFIIALFVITISLSGLSSVKATQDRIYTNEAMGVSFSYPNNIVIDPAASREAPLSVVFNHGQAPFTVSILFKEVKGDSLEQFIQNERQSQIDGGYQKQVAENTYEVGGEIQAIEFVRNTRMGTIYYYVFSSIKHNKLLALWHVTSDMGDPDQKALDAYQLMKKSLKISK